ncbi:MAG: NADPH:quinone reductase [Planctomycetes bacterium]|nr:NADPH:quinone reductase [Planctomycetota bacterium]
MKTIIVAKFGDENVLEYKDAPVPEPNDNEVRVKLEAIGVNPVETYIRSGQDGNKPALPYTPGNDGAGTIDAVGKNVETVAQGDRVFIAAASAKRNTGTYAEYVVCDADAVKLLPPGVSFAQGAGLGTPGLASAYSLFGRAQAKPGDTVLIHGATGGVGTLAVQLARRAGMRVFGTAGNGEGEKLVRELGAHAVFNHKEQGYADKISEAAGRHGIDVVIEMVANVNLVRDLAMIAPHGRIVVVGSKGSVEINPRDTMSKNAAILGMMINGMSHRNFIANMARLSAGLETGMKVVLNQELPLRDAAQAHRLMAGDRAPGKIILVADAR